MNKKYWVEEQSFKNPTHRVAYGTRNPTLKNNNKFLIDHSKCGSKVPSETNHMLILLNQGKTNGFPKLMKSFGSPDLVLKTSFMYASFLFAEDLQHF